MNFVTKLIVSIITISCTIVASLWGAFEILDLRMDRKVDGGKKEVLTIVYNFKSERNALIKALDDKNTVQFVALAKDVTETRKDIRTLLNIARKAQVFNPKPEEHSYTIMELRHNEGKHL